VSSISNRLYASFGKEMIGVWVDLFHTAVGVGVAIIYNCLMYQSLLWDTMGPATLFSASCPNVDLFIINGDACTKTHCCLVNNARRFNGFNVLNDEHLSVYHRL
jgi:hypothetical protein